jgi:hypothetical protein
MRAGCIDINDEYAIRIKTERLRRKTPECREQQRGADDQYERHCNLRGNQGGR